MTEFRRIAERAEAGEITDEEASIEIDRAARAGLDSREPQHDAEIEAVRPADGRCQCSCGCHNGHYIGCRNATGDPRVQPEYRAIACFECLTVCDG